MSNNDPINALWGHLSELDADALRKHVRRVRSDRKVRKEKVADRKARVGKSDKALTKAQRMLQGMSPEEIAKLIGKL